MAVRMRRTELRDAKLCSSPCWVPAGSRIRGGIIQGDRRFQEGTATAPITIVLLLGSTPLCAQCTRPTALITPAARAAAGTLLDLMRVEHVVRASIEASFDAHIEAQPLMAPFRPTMQAWVDRYFQWPTIRARLTDVYAGAHTETELQALVAFYRTPVGQRTAALAPELAKRGSAIGADLAQEHLAELQRMIQARAAELQAAPPASRSTPP
jgi:uncharacterized protein